MSNNNLVDGLKKIVEPIVIELGYELYYLEYIRENHENFLRIYIDSNEGVTLDDCEKVSRSVGEQLDLIDPIKDSYYLEISSPGIERRLYTDKHLKKYIGEKVFIKLNTLLNGKRKMEGILIDFNEKSIVIDDNEKVSIPRDKIDIVRLVGDF